MVEQNGRRILILDTSVLVHDPDCIEAFPHDTIVISSWVIDELDRLKRSEGERGEHARQASRIIHEYSLDKGFPDLVYLKSGGILKACSKYNLTLETESNAHDKTIALAKRLESETPEVMVAVLSKDPNLRIKTRMQGVQSVDYEGKGRAHDPYGLFPGYFQIILNERGPIDELYKNQWINVGNITHATSLTLDHLIPNQCVYFTFEGKDTLAIYKKNEARFRLVSKPKINGDADNKSIKGVQPRNCEQAFAYSLLTDPHIAVVALVGNAGPGKTLMSLLAGYRQLKSEFEGAKSSGLPRSASYNRIMVFRPTVEMGEKLGFLPGQLEEKIEPWMYPIFDNMDLILEHSDTGAKGTKNYDPVVDLINRNILQILPINYIRGRSIHDTFMIIDEAQNFSGDKLRSLLTRAGRGTKVVLTGDITQIDDPYMDEYSNGLSYLISNFMGQEMFGYTIMERGEERSILAKLAAELLQHTISRT